VVVGRLADQPCISGPPIEINEKSAGETLDRLLVARVLPAHLEAGTISFSEGSARRATRSESAWEGAATKEASALPVAAQGSEGKLTDSSSLETSSSETETDTGERKRTIGEAAAEARASADSVKEREQVLEFLVQWKEAWEQKSLDRFEKMYHPNFGGGNMNYDNFVKSKKKFFRKYRTIRLKMERVQIMKLGDKFVVRFLQSFQGDKYSDQGWKRMVLAGDKTTRLQILREEWSPL
jgi:hypothetical protein